MEYGLVRAVLGSDTFVAIGEEEFSDIKSAKEGVLQCLFIEQKFDLVIENLLELETTLLDSATRHMLLQDHDWQSFQGERTLFNRRLVNLLTACRTYVDHTKHHIKNCFREELESAPDVSGLFSREYDRRLGYRAAEALRNYVQHRGFPVHSVTFDSRWLGSGDETKAWMRCGVSPYLRPEELRQDGSFKQSVLTELETLGDKIDLKVVVRDYVEGLAAVHKELRQELQSKVDGWEALLGSITDRFAQEEPDGRVVGLNAVKRDEEGRSLERIQVFEDFMTYRKALARKNAVLRTLSRRYVSSEVIEK